jgi:hypothetical protein
MLDMSRIDNYKAKADKIKTTNINILLNKVRLDKRKEFNNRIFYTFLLVSIISLVGIFVAV